MEEQKKNMDDLFRQQLNDYQEAPRSGMWDRIEGNLDKIDATKKPGNKSTGGSRGFMGYSIVILLLIAAAFFIYKQSSKSANAGKTALANNTIKSSDKENAPATVKIDNTQSTHNNTAGLTNKAQADNNSASTAPAQVNSNTQRNNETVIAVKHATRRAHTANRTAKRNNKPSQKSTLTTNNSATVVNNKDNNTVDQSSTTNKSTKQATEIESNTSANTTTAKASASEHKKQNNKTSKDKEEVATAKTNSESVSPESASSKVSAAKHVKAEPALAQKKAKSNNNATLILPAAVTTEKKSNQHADLANTTIPKDNTRNNVDAPVPDKKEKLKKAAKQSVPSNTDVAKQNIPATKPAVSKANKNIDAEKKKTEPAGSTKKIAEIIPASKPAVAKESITSSSLKQNAETTKPDVAAKESATANNIDSSTKNSPAGSGSNDIAKETANAFSFQGGVKLSYEQGFGTYTTSKFIGAVYAQVALSDKFGILFQPAIKYTQLKNNIDYGSKSYYNNTGTQIAQIDTIAKDSLYKYHYYGSYDSIIVKTKNTTTSYIGFELPIMLKYKLSSSFSLLGGVNIDISNLFVLGDNTNTMHLRTAVDSSGILHGYEVNAYLNSVKYTHPGMPYSSYVSSATTAQSTVRVGYMFGLDYSLADKFTLEFLLTQSLSGYNNVTDKNIKGLYSQPYFRLSIGYQFLNITRKKIPYNGGL